MRRRRFCRAIWCAVAVLGAVAVTPLAQPATAADRTAKVPRASGPPIPVTFVNLDATSSTLPARQGAKAAMKELNRTGGISGRPIALTECVTDQTPEKGKACMDAAAAAKPVAVLAVQPGASVDALASLAAAGVPYVGQTCNTNATLSGQFATFCFGSDFVGLYATSANYLKSLTTIKRVALPYIAVPAATTGVTAYAIPIFQRAGITAVGVPIPEGTADITQLWIAMLEANPPPDATVGLLTGPGCITAMKTEPTTPTQKPLVLPAMCTDADVVSDAGPTAKGTLFVRQTAAIDRKNVDVKTYDKAMARFAAEVDPGDVYAQAGFASVMNLASALRTIPVGTTVDAAATTNALRAAKAVPLFLGGGATYTCDGTAFPGLKSLCSVQSHVVEYQGKRRWVDKGVF
jgi:branched-chain amino acid transport system substrate-binding protein